jgi:uncharacterized tellurite resistance protein B-like protein
LLYVGRDLPAVSGYQTEPALIDPRLPVDRDNPNRAGANVPYWPSYSSLTPSDRAAYLEWLTGGRSQPDAYIGYVFLFFYGLERRVLARPDSLKSATGELRTIAAEVDRLLTLYGPGGRSFARYAGGFLSLLTLATQDTGRAYERQPPARLVVGEPPLLLKLGLGQAAADARPLSADWALAWVEATTPLRTAATRCPVEFRALFRVRYADAFGEGLRVSAGRTKLGWTYRPASSSFGGEFTIKLDVPDVIAEDRSLAKLVALAERCCEDLDAYSRWLGRHGAATSGLATLALLPAEIVPSHTSHDVDSLCRSMETAMGTGAQAVIDAEPLVRAWPSGHDGKLAKADAVLLAQALERRGYGLEPDVRFGGRVLTAPGGAVAFRLPTGAPTAPTRQYEAATLLLHMAAVLSAADDDVTQAESEHVVDHLQTALHLTGAERARLTAHFAWLQLGSPGTAGIKKRVAALAPTQRRDIARFLVTLAAADGRIAPAEVSALTRIYRLLGLDPQTAYRDVHALAQSQTDEPVVVRPASETHEFAIPKPPSVEAPIALDMGRVARTLAETAAVAAILDEVFDEDEGVPQGRAEPTPAVPGLAADVQTRERELLRALGERAEWSRVEFERLAERLQVMPDGALERLNEAALDRFGTPVCEGADPIVIDATLVREMLA